MIQSIQTLRSRIGPLWRVYHPRRFTKAMKVLNDFVEPFVERAASQNLQDLEEKDERGEKVNFTESLSQFTQDRKVLRDQLVSTYISLGPFALHSSLKFLMIQDFWLVEIQRLALYLGFSTNYLIVRMSTQNCETKYWIRSEQTGGPRTTSSSPWNTCNISWMKVFSRKSPILHRAELTKLSPKYCDFIPSFLLISVQRW